MNLSRGLFLVINNLQACYQAQESSLQFIKKYGDNTQKESASRRLASARPLKGLAISWAARFWKEGESEELVQDLKRHSKKLLQNLKQDLDAEADRLEATLQVSELPQRSTVVEMLASMARQANTDELILRGCVTMTQHGDHGPLNSANQGHANPEPRLLALRHFESLLEADEHWEEWDLMSLRARILTLPELMRHGALEAELLSDTLSEGAPELTPEAVEGWAKAGFSSEEGAVWLGARFMSEEAAVWKKAGIAVAAQALDWSAMSVNAAEAADWWKQGFLPEEARCYLAAGLESAEASALVRHAFGNFENLRPWILSGFSIAEALSWKEKGPHSADQALALALRDRTQKGAAIVPSALITEVPPESKTQGPVLLFWGRLFNKAHAGFKLDPLPSGEFFLAAKDSLQRCGVPEGVNAPEMLLEWRDEIKKAAEAQSLSGDAAGSFYLATLENGLPEGQKASLFWGAEFGDDAREPWAASMDYSAAENWQARLKRKSDEWGEALNISVVMGRGPQGGWLLAMSQSLQQCDDGSVRQLQTLEAPKQWREEFEDFSRIMDLPLKKPRWMMGLADFSLPS